MTILLDLPPDEKIRICGNPWFPYYHPEFILSKEDAERVRELHRFACILDFYNRATGRNAVCENDTSGQKWRVIMPGPVQPKDSGVVAYGRYLSEERSKGGYTRRVASELMGLDPCYVALLEEGVILRGDVVSDIATRASAVGATRHIDEFLS